MYSKDSLTSIGSVDSMMDSMDSMDSMGSAIVAEMIATTAVATMVATTAVATITATKTVDLHTVVFAKPGRSMARRFGWSGWSLICPTEYSTLSILTAPKGSVPTGLTGSVVSIVPTMVSTVLVVSSVSDVLLVCL